MTPTFGGGPAHRLETAAARSFVFHGMSFSRRRGARRDEDAHPRARLRSALPGKGDRAPPHEGIRRRSDRDAATARQLLQRRSNMSTEDPLGNAGWTAR